MPAHNSPEDRRSVYRERTPLLTRDSLRRYFPAWALLITAALMLAPKLLFAAFDTALDAAAAVPGVLADAADGAVEALEQAGSGVAAAAEDALSGLGTLLRGRTSHTLAPLFTAEIDHWERDILRWAEAYALDPNLLATVMQIESCGHPTIASPAGAQGLFQVMPFHFASDENPLSPYTNALRGANFLNYCLDAADGDTGLALACYNGGPSVLTKPFDQWLAEPQRYYTWGTGIYADAQRGSATSATLDRWLGAGGATLCAWAAEEISRR